VGGGGGGRRRRKEEEEEEEFLATAKFFASANQDRLACWRSSPSVLGGWRGSKRIITRPTKETA